MFNADFYPTPPEVIETMLQGFDIAGKTILEPSAGKGNIVDFCFGAGAAAVMACELEPDLRKILDRKCNVISSDFLTVKSEEISHVDFIIMNPPFSADEKHILHAWNIAPEGCQIISLCNNNTISNRYYRSREELHSLITNYGTSRNLGDCFATSERKTGVEIGLVQLTKPITSDKSEWDGFFLEDDPTEQQYNGIMPYNFIRDLVNRYVGAINIFDKQLDAAVEMNALTSSFYSSQIAMSIASEDKPKSRNDYKKDLQKQAWLFIFKKMNMEKYATRGLKADINKFVEQQQHIPFTMRNIYRMLEIVIGTQEQRMDKAVLEVFDRLTQHTHENRYNVEGWKTNSHYLFNHKFIMPYMASIDYEGKLSVSHHEDRYSAIDDLTKALCYITGENYDNIGGIWAFFHKAKPSTNNYRTEYYKYEFNTWYEWGFFEMKGFKKGTMHFKFRNMDHWAMLNQRVGKLKGYPLFEHVKQNKRSK